MGRPMTPRPMKPTVSVMGRKGSTSAARLPAVRRFGLLLVPGLGRAVREVAGVFFDLASVFVFALAARVACLAFVAVLAVLAVLLSRCRRCLASSPSSLSLLSLLSSLSSSSSSSSPPLPAARLRDCRGFRRFPRCQRDCAFTRGLRGPIALGPCGCDHGFTPVPVSEFAPEALWTSFTIHAAWVFSAGLSPARTGEPLVFAVHGPGCPASAGQRRCSGRDSLCSVGSSCPHNVKRRSAPTPMTLSDCKATYPSIENDGFSSPPSRIRRLKCSTIASRRSNTAPDSSDVR